MALQGYLSARARDAQEFAAMSSMPRKAAKYLIPFRHHLLDHPMDVRKRSAKRSNHLFEIFAPLLLARKWVEFPQRCRQKNKK